MTTKPASPNRWPPALRLLARVLRNTLQALIGSYALSLTGFLALRAITGDSLPQVAILNSYVHVLLTDNSSLDQPPWLPTRLNCAC